MFALLFEWVLWTWCLRFSLCVAKSSYCLPLHVHVHFLSLNTDSTAILLLSFLVDFYASVFSGHPVPLSCVSLVGDNKKPTIPERRLSRELYLTLVTVFAFPSNERGFGSTTKFPLYNGQGTQSLHCMSEISAGILFCNSLTYNAAGSYYTC